MSPGKCVGVLIILGVLFYLFIFNRRKMNQLTILITITWIGLSALRLWNMRDDADQVELLINVAIFLGGGFLVWAALWGGQRWLGRKSNGNGSAKRRNRSG